VVGSGPFRVVERVGQTTYKVKPTSGSGRVRVVNHRILKRHVDRPGHLKDHENTELTSVEPDTNDSEEVTPVTNNHEPSTETTEMNSDPHIVFPIDLDDFNDLGEVAAAPARQPTRRSSRRQRQRPAWQLDYRLDYVLY